jgi:hypothetical protein
MKVIVDYSAEIVLIRGFAPSRATLRLCVLSGILLGDLCGQKLLLLFRKRKRL